MQSTVKNIAIIKELIITAPLYQCQYHYSSNINICIHKNVQKIYQYAQNIHLRQINDNVYYGIAYLSQI